MKLITENRLAYHEYFVLDTYEAGISLDGGEVKSIRNGSVNLKDSFCLVAGGNVLVKNMHVAVYDKAGAYNKRDAKRDRQLLLHKREINALAAKANEKGLAIVPLKLYFVGSLVKMEVGVCKGKHTYDKKQVIMEQDLVRKAERDIKEYFKK